MTDAKDLTECYACGAAVANATRHREWHESRGEVEPKELKASQSFFA